MRKLPLVLLALAGCGSSSGLPFSVNANLATYPSQLDDGGLDPSILLVSLAHLDQGPLDCAGSFDGGLAFTGEAISIAMVRLDGTAVLAGTYPIVLSLSGFDGGTAAAVAQIDLDAGVTYAALSGTVNLTTVGSTITGNVTAQMAQVAPGTSRYDLSTSFDTPLCLP